MRLIVKSKRSTWMTTTHRGSPLRYPRTTSSSFFELVVIRVIVLYYSGVDHDFEGDYLAHGTKRSR